MYKRLQMFVVFVFGLGLSSLYAQETIPAGGGNASGATGTVSYSVGQVFFTTNEGDEISVVQGIQQPYEIYVVTALEETRTINLSVSAFPNPATDFLKLKIDDDNIHDLSFKLFDMSGKLYLDEKITKKQTEIVMSHLTPAVYFITVSRNNNEIKTFKIVKN